MKKNIEREKLLKKELPKIVEVLKEEYRPDKIVLFGSLANGRVGEWSDIDLVIIKETKKKFTKRLKEVALMTKPKVGVDFLVYTPMEFKRMQERMNFFILDEVIGRGKVIYDRQNPLDTDENICHGWTRMKYLPRMDTDEKYMPRIGTDKFK